MSAPFTLPAADILNPVDASGNPRGPDIGELQAWGIEVETILTALSTGAALLYSSKAAMDADLLHPANSAAVVIGDGTASNNGYYRKNGASGTGSWIRVGDVPGNSFIKATNAGGGTANAIVATTPSGIPSADGAALITLNITTANTASPATVAFDGGSALTIKTNSGVNVPTGGLASGMLVLGTKADSGTTFRLISDIASSADRTAAEAAQAAAEAAAADAEAAVAGVSLPSIVSGNAGWKLVVLPDESGYILVQPTTVSILDVLTTAQGTDVLSGTNSLSTAINVKIAALISAAAARPGSVVDLRALNGTWPGATSWFNSLHTADITLLTGRVTLPLHAASSEQFQRPSLLNWVCDGTLFNWDALCSGITSNDAGAPGMLNTYVGSTTCSGTPDSNVFTFASTTGLHIGSRVAIAGNVLVASMIFTLNGAINSGATSFLVDEDTNSYVAGSEVYVRIDDEIILCTVAFGSNHTFAVTTRGALGTTPASHSDNATIYWCLALTATVTNISGTTVTLDAAAQNPCGAGTPVHFGAYRSHLSGNFDVDGGFERYIESTVTITNATPGVITWGTADAEFDAVGLVVGRALYLTTTGALPTGLTASTTYYIKTIVDVPTRKFTVSLTPGGSAINTSSAGSGTHTGHVDRPYQFMGFGFPLSSECHVRGKVGVKRCAHGGILTHGAYNCDIQFDEVRSCCRPILGLGAGIWIFGSNDLVTVRARRVYDTSCGFVIDDKTSNSSTFGLDNTNANCQVHIGDNAGQSTCGGITRSKNCVAVVGFLDAALQGAYIDNDESQSSTPGSDDTVGNTVVVHAMAGYLPPTGDAVNTKQNSIFLPSLEFEKVITVATTSIGANTTAEAVSLTCVGAKANAQVQVTPLFSLPTGLICGHGRSASDDHVTIRFMNTTSGSLDAAGDYLVTVRNR